MSKGLKRYIPIWAILLAALIIIVETLPIEKDDLFTTAYFFVVIAFIIELFIASRVLNNNEKELSQPVFIYSIIGVIMVFATNWWLVAKQYYHKSWFYIVVNVAVLALHYVFLLVVQTNMKQNVERDEHVKEKTDTMLSLTKQVKTLYDTTSNKDIYRLYEAMRHSNKASKNPEIEKKIEEKVLKLESMAETEIATTVDELIILISKRDV